jgi:hypothetical protein
MTRANEHAANDTRICGHANRTLSLYGVVLTGDGVPLRRKQAT